MFVFLALQFCAPASPLLVVLLQDDISARSPGLVRDLQMYSAFSLRKKMPFKVLKLFHQAGYFQKCEYLEFTLYLHGCLSGHVSYQENRKNSHCGPFLYKFQLQTKLTGYQLTLPQLLSAPSPSTWPQSDLENSTEERSDYSRIWKQNVSASSDSEA